MNANQLKNILCSLRTEFSTETWDAALALMTAEAPKKAAKAVAADGSEKPKRVLTAEHKAAMQAGRQKAKAAKDSQELPGETIVTEKPKAAADGSEKPKRVLTAEHKAKMQAGRIAKKAAAAPKKEEPPPAAVVEQHFPVAETIEVAGKTYVRLADGGCYEPGEIDGELGAWAGLFKNGVLDTTVQES